MLVAKKSEVKKLGPPKMIKSLKQPSEDEVYGPGWRFEKCYWFSSVAQLKFTAFQACKFEVYRVELDGNEDKAYYKYQKYFGASAES